MGIKEFMVGNLVATEGDPENILLILEIGEYKMKVTTNWSSASHKLASTDWIDNEILVGIPLDEKWMRRGEFTLERARNKDKDVDGIWYNGFSLLESSWDGDFNFATYVRGNGEFKSGYQIPYVHRLQNLVKSLSGRDLVFKTDMQLKKEMGDKLQSKLLETVVEFVEEQKMKPAEFCSGFNCAYSSTIGHQIDECQKGGCWLKTKLKKK